MAEEKSYYRNYWTFFEKSKGFTDNLKKVIAPEKIFYKNYEDKYLFIEFITTHPGKIRKFEKVVKDENLLVPKKVLELSFNKN